MPQFMSTHRAPSLDASVLQQGAAAAYNAKLARFLQIYVNLGDGFMTSIYEAESAEVLQEQFEILGFPFEEMHEIQFAQSRGELEQMLGQASKN